MKPAHTVGNAYHQGLTATELTKVIWKKMTKKTKGAGRTLSMKVQVKEKSQNSPQIRHITPELQIIFACWKFRMFRAQGGQVLARLGMSVSEGGQEVGVEHVVEEGVEQEHEHLRPTEAQQARFQQTKWRRGTLKHFSKKNSNSEWVQMGRYFFARCVSSCPIILVLTYDVQHVLDGNPLGHFAVKKIAVGESHSYLLKILREVRLLERLHHPNIVTYQ